MTGYYLGRRESQAVMVILVHYHMQDSLVARVHRHGGPDTTPDLDITAGFVRTDSDVPSLPVMSLKIRKLLGLG